MINILIAGFGNLLRGDDGFGVEVARRLIADGGIPGSVKVVEVGIAGITLVQELLDGYDACLIIDAVDRKGKPGTIYLLEPEIPDIDSYGSREMPDFSADMHYTESSKALILAKTLGVLPKKVLIIGCQPSIRDELGIGLSKPVKGAVDKAIGELKRITATMGVIWDKKTSPVPVGC